MNVDLIHGFVVLVFMLVWFTVGQILCATARAERASSIDFPADDR